MEVASLVDQRFTCKTKCVTDIESIKTLVHTEGAAMYPGLPPLSTYDIPIHPPAKKTLGSYFKSTGDTADSLVSISP